MSRSSRLVRLVVLALGLLAAPASAQFLEFDSGLVRVTGLEPQERVALFGISRMYDADTSSRVVRKALLLDDDDGDGAVELEAEVVPNSIWVAVRYSTGAWAAATPPTGELRNGDALAPAIEREKRSGRDRLRLEGNTIDLLYVRPGTGAWRAIAYDGADEEGARNGRLRIDRSAFRPLEGEVVAPTSFETRDLVVGIDPETLRFLIRRGNQLPVEETN